MSELIPTTATDTASLQLALFRRAELTFENDYGLSIVPDFRRGDDVPRFEIAVKHDGTLCYQTPITDDVIPGLTWAEVLAYAAQVAALSPTYGWGRYCVHGRRRND
jgi:hypothetical protein